MFKEREEAAREEIEEINKLMGTQYEVRLQSSTAKSSYFFFLRFFRTDPLAALAGREGAQHVQE